jgi:hypothetical protein
MHHRYHDKGLVILGIAFEHVPPERAPAVLKEFIDQARIPYRCLIGDDATVARVPNFVGYPTTLLLDSTGKVRFRSLGSQEGEAEAIEDAAIVLLDELRSQSAAKGNPAP